MALLALLFAGGFSLLAGGWVQMPGASLARAVADRMLCAVELRECGEEPAPLEAAYGEEVARLVRRHAPNIVWERNMRSLPTDFRRCRRDPACADGPLLGRVLESEAGHPVTAFVRVVDRRRSGGRLYIQYWLYYPNSTTLVPVRDERNPGYHDDDWEQYGVRIGRDGDVEARASSHHSYNCRAGGLQTPVNALSDMGWVRKRAWCRATGWYYVSGGSHAGRIIDRPDGAFRHTAAESVQLVPLERLARGEGGFAVSPPWRKAVWSDPESDRT